MVGPGDRDSKVRAFQTSGKRRIGTIFWKRFGRAAGLATSRLKTGTWSGGRPYLFRSQNENRMFDSLKLKDDRFHMKTVSVREMKAQWAEIEEQVARGETFEVLNRGKPVVRIVSATPRQVVKWEDHLVTALPAKGMTGQEAVDADREGRW